jgi:hypothetical protein
LNKPRSEVEVFPDRHPSKANWGRRGIPSAQNEIPKVTCYTSVRSWEQCRAGKVDASKFGTIFSDMRGLWYIAGNLVCDLAALNKVELLPWDVWGAQPKPSEQLAFFDDLAALTRVPDESFVKLRTLYERDDRLRTPLTVFTMRCWGVWRRFDGRAVGTYTIRVLTKVRIPTSQIARKLYIGSGSGR